jgi:hypothetical protein
MIPQAISQRLDDGSHEPHAPASRGRREKECPFCGEWVTEKAKKCKHCGEVIDVVWREAADGDDRRRYAGARESETDVPGVLGLVLGVLAVVCLVMGCFTCGMTYFAAAPLAAVGAGCSAFGRGNSRVAGLALNIVTLIPAIVLFMMMLLGIGAAAITP